MQRPFRRAFPFVLNLTRFPDLAQMALPFVKSREERAWDPYFVLQKTYYRGYKALDIKNCSANNAISTRAEMYMLVRSELSRRGQEASCFYGSCDSLLFESSFYYGNWYR